MKFIYRKKMFDIEGFSSNDHIYKKIETTKCFYEIDMLASMYSLRDPQKYTNSVAIDVGANIGNHSVFFNAFLSEHVISIEPNPSVFRTLKRNLQINTKNATAFDCAVGEVDGYGAIFLPDAGQENIGMAKVTTESSDRTIKIRTLDAVFSEWLSEHQIKARIDYIKIDVEGMELSVLKGAAEIISEHHPSLYIEAATKAEFDKLNLYLTDMGYSALEKWGATPMYHFEFQPSTKLVVLTKIHKMLRSLGIKRRKR